METVSCQQRPMREKRGAAEHAVLVQRLQTVSAPPGGSKTATRPTVDLPENGTINDECSSLCSRTTYFVREVRRGGDGAGGDGVRGQVSAARGTHLRLDSCSGSSTVRYGYPHS
eukprot:5791388-Prymnesium_polylepis.1